MLFRKKTNLEKHFGILFSARLYRTDVETYNIQRERDGYTYIWVIFFIDGLENNLRELLYYNIFLVYPPFAYAIRSLAHMELLSCHGPRQPLEGAHGHMSSVLLHVAWFHIQLDSKTYSKESSQWRLRFLIQSEHHRFPKSWLLLSCVSFLLARLFLRLFTLVWAHRCPVGSVGLFPSFRTACPAAIPARSLVSRWGSWIGLPPFGNLFMLT